MLLGGSPTTAVKNGADNMGMYSPGYDTRQNRNCWWWFSSDPATYKPVMRRMDSAALRLLHQEKVMEGVGFAQEEQAPFWRVLLVGCCIEASMYFTIHWLMKTWAPWGCFLFWVNLRGFLYNVGSCTRYCTRHHARLLATLASILPFCWLLPWCAYLVLEDCTCHEVRANVWGSSPFWHYQLDCPKTFSAGGIQFFMDPTSALAVIISVGVPLFYMYVVFLSGTQLVRLKIFDKMWKLQVLALDVFDVCALVTQVFNPDAFRFLKASQPFSVMLLSFVPVMLLAVLYETARELRLLESFDHPEAPRTGSIMTLSAFTAPMLLIRLGICVQGVSVTQAVWILKNVVCGLSHVMTAMTNKEDNAISQTLRKAAGMLPGHELVEDLGFAEVYADTSTELREKVAMLTKLIDVHGQAVQRLTFQRALLGAQANIFEGVQDLNMKALTEGFTIFDVNRDYRLSREELRTMMKTVAKFISEEEIDRIMTNADYNGDGMIDYREFSERLILDPEVRAKVLGAASPSARGMGAGLGMGAGMGGPSSLGGWQS